MVVGSAGRVEYLASLKARQVVRLLEEGQTSTLELIEACESRRRLVDDVIGATPQPCFDRGRKWRSEASGVLRGLPVLIKGSQAVRGETWCSGSALYANRVATESDPIVEAIEAAGGVVVGLTNVPEFEAGAQTFNELFPTTTTPYDARRTSGGSSGGSAAALASRQAWLASGADLGGSLRIPAAFCGIVGFRTTPGVVSPAEAFGLVSVAGPMARDVIDVGLFLDALAPRTASWRAAAEAGAARRPDRRVAFSTLGCPVRSELTSIARAAVDSLWGPAATVDEPWPLDTARQCFQALRAASFEQTFGSLDAARLKPEIVFNANKDRPGAKAAALRASESILSPAVDRFFHQFDLLATPATLDVPFGKTVRYPTHDYGSLRTGDALLTDYCEWFAITYLVSVVNAPAVVLPCGRLDDGLPVAIQLVAKPGNDALLLQAAAALEAHLDLPFQYGLQHPVLQGAAPLRGAGPTTAQEARIHLGLGGERPLGSA